MSAAARAGAPEVLKRNGKSFWFASLFLPEDTAFHAAQLYAFCRAMDDLADDPAQTKAPIALKRVRDDLRRGHSTEPVVANFLELAHRFHLPLEAADYLLEAFLQDATTALHIADQSQLVRYCYGVAGTVGLMMSPLLGAVDIRASHPAIDLGIAMQMTNIARDVLEDARNGRRYLPGSWVDDLPATTIVSDPSCRQRVGSAIERLLNLADLYYASAACGLALLPPQTARAIEIAGALYREIGARIRKNHYRWWLRRAYVPLGRKAAIAVSACLGQSRLRRLTSSAEAEELHDALAGLPGTS